MSFQFRSSVQFNYSVHPCISMKLCCLIPYFLISGYLLRTPDNSNLFRFPLKVLVIGSRQYSLSRRRNTSCRQRVDHDPEYQLCSCQRQQLNTQQKSLEILPHLVLFGYSIVYHKVGPQVTDKAFGVVP